MPARASGTSGSARHSAEPRTHLESPSADPHLERSSRPARDPDLVPRRDQDDAEPWYQGIELYLAMRRLGKDCVFLQYRGEPHHLKQYANKLDYTLKFKEYLDHYLKGEPAPEWIRTGIPFKGE